MPGEQPGQITTDSGEPLRAEISLTARHSGRGGRDPARTRRNFRGHPRGREQQSVGWCPAELGTRSGARRRPDHSTPAPTPGRVAERPSWWAAGSSPARSLTLPDPGTSLRGEYRAPLRHRRDHLDHAFATGGSGQPCRDPLPRGSTHVPQPQAGQIVRQTRTTWCAPVTATPTRSEPPAPQRATSAALHTGKVTPDAGSSVTVRRRDAGTRAGAVSASPPPAGAHARTHLVQRRGPQAARFLRGRPPTRAAPHS